MKKQFENVKIEIITVTTEDIIKTSQVFNDFNLPGFNDDNSFF